MLTHTVRAPPPSASLSRLLDSNSCAALLVRDKLHSESIYSQADQEGRGVCVSVWILNDVLSIFMVIA